MLSFLCRVLSIFNRILINTERLNCNQIPQTQINNQKSGGMTLQQKLIIADILLIQGHVCFSCCFYFLLMNRYNLQSIIFQQCLLLLNLVIINQMRSQLLCEEEEGDQQYKSLRVYAPNTLFSGSISADEPIFKKQGLKYDKYQLAKLISFEQFELIMRPFKNDPTFKNCKFWQLTFNILASVAMVVLFAVLILHELDVDVDSPLFLLWQIMISVATLAFFLSIFRIQFVHGTAKKALKTYCESLDLTLEHITITAVLRPAINSPIKWLRTIKGSSAKYALFCEEFSYFQIKSTHILNDQTNVKLYNQGSALTGVNTNMESPICQAKEFEFNNANLEKIIPFADLQAMLRPFKNNQYFKRYAYFMKTTMYSLFLLIFLIVPLFFHLDQTTLLIVIYGQAAVFYAVTVFFLCKATKAKGQMIVDFVDYCKQISRSQEKIEVIVHINENNSSQQKNQGIYCIEVKKKDN